MLRLPRLISRGCVLQQGVKTRISGWSDPGRTVTVRLQHCSVSGKAGGDGRFDLYLTDLCPGGPFSLKLENASGETIEVDEIYVGEVWLSSGQSNMELPMSRVSDRYPGAVESSENSRIHIYKVSEHFDFEKPLNDCQSGEWKTAAPETVRDFSALSLFFAQDLEKYCGVPVGIINVSLGGSPIEAWMSREALAEEPEALAEADFWNDAEKIRRQIQRDADAQEEWQNKLKNSDRGIFGDTAVWAEKKAEDGQEPWKEIFLPDFLSGQGIEDLIGSIWLKKTFSVPEEMAVRKTRLWLGTMTDSDTVWINGTKVGETAYQYPPRKYEIPAGVLKAGKNEITVRLVCNNGRGRFTPGKEYRIFDDRNSVNLEGVWEYRIGCRTEEPAPEQTFISWMATGLYQGMLHPCQYHTVRGILWYQGESNDRQPETYERLLKKMILSWRKEWKQEHLPFVIAQLPGFEIDLQEDGRWPELRRAQQAAAELPETAVTVNLDLGEKNDLHPTGKKEVARRMLRAALGMVYQERVPVSGPVPEETVLRGEKTVCIRFRLDENDRTEEPVLKTSDGSVPGEFELAGEDGKFRRVKAEISGLTVLLDVSTVTGPRKVRYAWRNAPDQGLLCSPSGILVSPFERTVSRE